MTTNQIRPIHRDREKSDRSADQAERSLFCFRFIHFVVSQMVRKLIPVGIPPKNKKTPHFAESMYRGIGIRKEIKRLRYLHLKKKRVHTKLISNAINRRVNQNPTITYAKLSIYHNLLYRNSPIKECLYVHFHFMLRILLYHLRYCHTTDRSHRSTTSWMC